MGISRPALTGSDVEDLKLSIWFLSQTVDIVIWMEAQVWTLIGLLTATLFGALFYLGARIDALGDRIDAQGARIDAQSADLGARIDGQSARIDALTFRVQEQGKALADDIYKLGMKLDDHLRWHAG